MLPKLKDLSGKTFGRLTVLRRGEDQISANGRHRVMWICRCSCGKEVSVMTDNLTCGRTQSCGCFRSEKNTSVFSTHHETDTKLYGIWCAMKSRCMNPNATYYKNYGGRGICVCDEWAESYEAFREWAVSSGYDEASKHGECTIDRIDVNGNYEPSNCRWVDSVAQANNRRTNRNYTWNGETHNLTEWANLTGINPKTLFNRIYTGWTFEKAITTKPYKNK